MRVLFDHSTPFCLAHGGFQIQIEQTARALRESGVDVDYLRWWDDAQTGDVIHYFGRPDEVYAGLAQQKGLKLVIADLLTELGSRSRPLRVLQKALTESARTVLPPAFTARMGWRAFAMADAMIALTEWEAALMAEMFRAPRDRIHVVPNGVEEVFLQSAPQTRERWLVCTATITARKRVLELAEAAVTAQTPVWIIGQPYSKSDPYGQRFEALAARHRDWIRYEGAIHDRARLAEAYRRARGFVLLSTKESLSLSALEAAACGCPLLLTDLPWARTVFGEHANYCPVASATQTAAVLRRFYDQAPTSPVPPKPLTWREVAGQIKAVYETVLRTSR